MHSGEPGIDPYTRTVSDVYQDLFDEGSFIGKGIYDVDAFEQSMGGRFPDSRILSHDLLEGCYARSGLLSDVELFEDYPATYAADAARRHRWMRGDWQIASWLLPLVPGAAGQRYRNPLSTLSLWKIADNLRRSLVPIALLLAAAGGLDRAAIGAGLDSGRRCDRPGAVAAAIDAAIVAQATGRDSTPAPAGAARSAAARSWRRRSLRWPACRTKRSSAPMQSLRTTWRMLVSRRRRLEWSPSGDRPTTAQRGCWDHSDRCGGTGDRTRNRHVPGPGAAIGAHAARRRSCCVARRTRSRPGG